MELTTISARFFLVRRAVTRWNQRRLTGALQAFTHHELDVRDRAGVLELVRI